MRHDKEQQAFILDQDDLSALGMPSELSVWPERDINHLIEEATFAQNRIDDLDATYFPAGATHAYVQAEQAKRSRVLHQIRSQLASHLATGIYTTDDLPARFRPEN